MGSRRRLILYLLLNVLVSALVAGGVIYYYDRTHQAACTPAQPNGAAVLPSGGDIKVDITGVFGVGRLADEQLAIQNDGPQELELTGWYLADNKGLIYTFPQLTLHPGVKVQVHTKVGQDIPTDLYWGRDAPVWASGELAALYDAQGIVRAFYRIP
jgi:hypothetical protein